MYMKKSAMILFLIIVFAGNCAKSDEIFSLKWDKTISSADDVAPIIHPKTAKPKLNTVCGRNVVLVDDSLVENAFLFYPCINMNWDEGLIEADFLFTEKSIQVEPGVLFQIKSPDALGKGSRFFFRLALGKKNIF